ncbi:transposase [Nocardiopsis tropica]
MAHDPPRCSGRTGHKGPAGLAHTTIDSQSIRAKPGENTEPNPTARGKPDSRLHLLWDNQGLPLTCAISATTANDGEALQLLARAPCRALTPRPRRRRPTKLHGDKAYHSHDRCRRLRKRQIGVRIARPGVESSQRLSRHRYKVERSIARLGSYRRLNMHWECKASNSLAMLGIACILVCYKHLTEHNDDF